LHLVTEPLVAPGLGDHCHHGDVAGEHLAHLDVAVFHAPGVLADAQPGDMDMASRVLIPGARADQLLELPG